MNIIKNVTSYPEMKIIHTAFSNFTPFEEFEKMLYSSIERMKEGIYNCWIIDLTDVVILGKQHLNFVIEEILPRVKHFKITDVKIVKSKFNFDISFERHIKNALQTMNFNFEYTYGVQSLSQARH